MSPEEARSQTWACPDPLCFERLSAVVPLNTSPHFRHPANSRCAAASGAPETIWHRVCKRWLGVAELEELSVETAAGVTRPDVLVRNRTWAVEAQHSAISIATLHERMRRHAAAGFTATLWLLDETVVVDGNGGWAATWARDLTVYASSSVHPMVVAVFNGTQARRVVAADREGVVEWGLRPITTEVVHGWVAGQDLLTPSLLPPVTPARGAAYSIELGEYEVRILRTSTGNPLEAHSRGFRTAGPCVCSGCRHGWTQHSTPFAAAASAPGTLAWLADGRVRQKVFLGEYTVSRVPGCRLDDAAKDFWSFAKSVAHFS